MIKKTMLLHVPKNYKSKDPFINVAPLGLIGLGAYIRDEAKVEVQIVNLASYYEKNKVVDIVTFIKENSFDLIAINLHWHHQSFDVINVCEEIKQANPNVIITIGGYTASWYSKEILESHRQVDYVIRGDGEKPLVSLINAINNKKSMTTVPNLVYRENNSTIENSITFIADNDFLNNLKDWDLSLYKNDSDYCGYVIKSSMKTQSFFLPIGRGCSLSCSYCAGSKENQAISFRREHVSYRTPERVFEIIKNVIKYGFNEFYICFSPPEISDEWFNKLFKLIRENRVEISLLFECYTLPSKKFIKSFAETFDLKKSYLIYSPGTHDAELRRFYTAQQYSNTELEDSLAYCYQNKIKTVIYFSIFPNEEDLNWDKYKKKVDWIISLRNEFTNSTIFPIQMEPGSPWFINDNKFNVEKTIHTFEDYYDFHKKNVNHDLGYLFPKYIERLVYINSLDNTYISFDKLNAENIPNNHDLIFINDKELNEGKRLDDNSINKRIVIVKKEINNDNLVEIVEKITPLVSNIRAIVSESQINIKDIIDFESFKKHIGTYISDSIDYYYYEPDLFSSNKVVALQLKSDNSNKQSKDKELSNNDFEAALWFYKDIYKIIINVNIAEKDQIVSIPLNSNKNSNIRLIKIGINKPIYLILNKDKQEARQLKYRIFKLCYLNDVDNRSFIAKVNELGISDLEKTRLLEKIKSLSD